MLPKARAYFLIEDDDLLGNYAIWNKVSADTKKSQNKILL